MMKNKHLIVVSIDALVYEDLEYAKTLQTFGKLIENGAVIKRVKTIYPSLTHPVHATLLTGCPAGMTGIYSNDRFVPGVLDRPWFNHLDEIKCDTVLHAAHRAGLTTAVCRWPVTANAGGIVDYLVPEIMELDAKGMEDKPLEVYRSLGTSECVMDIVEEAINRFAFINTHPIYDELQIFCASEIIRRYKPNLVLTHPGYVDGERHRTGVFTDAVKNAIHTTDRWLESLVSAVNDAGIEDTTDFILLSDHGQINISREVCVNVLLAEKGYLKVNENGELEDWEAYVTSCGASAHVYLSRPTDKKLYSEIYQLLSNMAEDKLYGFGQVFTKDEVKEKYGLDGEFSFVLETDGFTGFNDEWVRPIVRELDVSDYRYGNGTHGHLPEKGAQPTFIGTGPSFKSGISVEQGNILNHAPTIAKALGIELIDSVGVAEDKLLKSI